MRILYWTSHFWPDVGGIEVLALETLPALQKRGYEFCVVAGKGVVDAPTFCLHNGVEVHRFDFLSAFAGRNIHALMAIQNEVAALKTRFAADLVHLNFVGHGPYIHFKTRAVSPAPLLMAIHSDFSLARSGPDTLFGQCLRGADWICSVSHATLSDVLRFVPEQEPRSMVIPNGLAVPAIVPAPLPFEPPHIVCLGRLEQDKGFDIALEAFARVCREFPGARISVVGDGTVRAALQHHAAQLGLGASATFTGRLEREAIAPMINSATMVVVPSRYREPFALVALEAAQMARPVVATRMAGLCETVADGKSGILVENENVGEFAAAMKFLIQNPAVAREMGEYGRARALEVFGLERCVDAYDALYQRIGNSQPKD